MHLTLRELQNAALRTSHRLSRCQIVFTKIYLLKYMSLLLLLLLLLSQLSLLLLSLLSLLLHKARDLKFLHNVHHRPRVMCHLSHVNCHFIWQIGGASCLRVWYQQGLHRLVFPCHSILQGLPVLSFYWFYQFYWVRVFHWFDLFNPIKCVPFWLLMISSWQFHVPGRMPSTFISTRKHKNLKKGL